MAERNAEVAPDKRIEFRVGTHVGDVVEESDGDLMGDGVNIPARLQAVATPGGICISDDGIVTLPRGEREASAAQEFSGCCDGGPPCVHRHSAKRAVRLG